MRKEGDAREEVDGSTAFRRNVVSNSARHCWALSEALASIQLEPTARRARQEADEGKERDAEARRELAESA